MGINLTELIVVFVVALLLFGPEQLPTLARQLGKLMGEFRKGSNALRREFYNSVYQPTDLRGDLASAARTLRTLKTEGVTAAMVTSLEHGMQKRPATTANDAPPDSGSLKEPPRESSAPEHKTDQTT
jgi:TatA/E family protein of Tat protein translocase